MEDKDLQAVYINRLNELLPTVDFAKLDRSCNSPNDSYAKEILKRMHDLCVEVYGTDHFGSNSYDFIEFPAVIRGRNTGHIGLGIITLDLSSSGEHWGTFFLTPKGIIKQGDKNLTARQSKYLSTVYIPYEYWYTVFVEQDHHVDFDNVPERIAGLLNYCHSEPLVMEENIPSVEGPKSNQQNGPVMN